jgi:hypothetical protein
MMSPFPERIAVTKVMFQSARGARYISFMSTGSSSAKIHCAQCEQPEANCQCEKYCCLCQSVTDIRVCTDGLMYCEPCRKACDYKTAD